MRLTIKITKEVLKESMMCGVNDCEVTENCAFSIALREIFPLAKTEETAIYPFWRSELIDNEISIPLSDNATEFIQTFDCLSPEERLRLRPRQFIVSVPDSVIESIGIEEAREIISKSSTLELVEG